MIDLMDRTQCTGTAKSTGARCKLTAIAGGTVCARYHGGGAPQVRAAAERRLEDARVSAEVTKLGLAIQTTPGAALQDALNRAASDVLVLGARVALLEPESWVERESFAGGGSRREVSPVLRAYWQALDRLAGISAKCVSLGIEAAAVSVVQRHGSEVVELLRRVLVGLGLQPSDERVVEVVTRELRAIEGGAA